MKELRRRSILVLAAVALALGAGAVVRRRQVAARDSVLDGGLPVATRPPTVDRSRERCDFKRSRSWEQVQEQVSLLDTPGREFHLANLEELARVADGHLEKRRFEKAELVASVALEIAPKYTAARDVMEDAARATINGGSYVSFSELRRERFRDSEEKRLRPGHDTLLLVDLSVREWENILAWARRSDLLDAPPLPRAITSRHVSLDADEYLHLCQVLLNTRMDLDFADSSLYDIVDYVQECAKINIVIAAEVRSQGVPDRKSDFHCSGMTIREILTALLPRYGLGFTFENRILLITDSVTVASGPVLETYPVQLLLAAGWASADLAARVREEVDPGAAASGRCGSVAVGPDGSLYVFRPPEAQSRVRSLLAALRP